jgi:hypothetical protein
MTRYLLYFCCFLFGVVAACQKAVEPVNPFSAIIRPAPAAPAPAPDSASLLGLHKNIFSRSCSVPGCHDGHFEPDFRTVESTYSTLVYHPVVKNDASNSFEYRVVPNNVAKSWLHERVTTDNQTLGRMPLYDNALSAQEVNSIKKWINAGAPDAMGVKNTLPNLQPVFYDVSLFLQTPEVWADTFRKEYDKPLGMLKNTPFIFYVAAADDSTPNQNLTNLQLKFSLDPYGFTNPVVVPVSYMATPKIVPNYGGPGVTGYFAFKGVLNTSLLQTGKIYYFRFYASDGDHAQPSESPTANAPQFLIQHFSVYVQP